MEILKWEFFARSTALVAEELVGKLFFWQEANSRVGGRIVETEAYLGKDDPACHSSKGMTPRNTAMFGRAGRHYLYRIYGVHMCYNITTDAENIPAAVLLRAIEPLFGLEEMAAKRGQVPKRRLTAGPGNICRALGLDLSLNGLALEEAPLVFADDGYLPNVEVSGRIGISQGWELPLRFFIPGNPYLSRN